jgi:hypothetical protein
MPLREAPPTLPAPAARRARGCAVAAALLLHGALALGLGLQTAQRAGDAKGTIALPARADAPVLWLHWVTAPTPSPAAAPMAATTASTTTLAPGSAASQAAARPARPESPVAAEGRGGGRV